MTTGRINQVAAQTLVPHEPQQCSPLPGTHARCACAIGGWSSSFLFSPQPKELRERNQLPPITPPQASRRFPLGPPVGPPGHAPRYERLAQLSFKQTCDFPRNGPSREPPDCAHHLLPGHANNRESSLFSSHTFAHHAFAQAFPLRGRRPRAPTAAQPKLPR